MADLGGGPVGVDTAIFIYFIEEHPQFLPLLEPLFREVNSGRKELVTSALTLLEVSVVPYRSGDHLLAGRYEALLTQSRGVHVADISGDHLRAAAQLKAATGVKTPQLAAQLFLRMIATFRPYPVSVSCNCHPTLGDPVGWFCRPCCVPRAVSFFNPMANPRCVRLLGIIKYWAVSEIANQRFYFSGLSGSTALAHDPPLTVLAQHFGRGSLANGHHTD
jgi:hypothetical protein